MIGTAAMDAGSGARRLGRAFFLGSGLGLLAQAARAARRWNRRRRMRRMLEELDDRMLSDIGLSRTDVMAMRFTRGQR